MPVEIHPWKIESSRYLLKDEWLTVRADCCRMPDGRCLDPFYVIEERDWVHVVAVDREGRFLVTRQYRHGVQRVTLEFPGGIVDPGEKPADAAVRELQEETGCKTSTGAMELIISTCANPARQTNAMHAYLARQVEPAGGGQDLDEAEEIEVLHLTREQVHAAIRSGEFCQASHIASFYLAEERLRTHRL